MRYLPISFRRSGRSAACALCAALIAGIAAPARADEQAGTALPPDERIVQGTLDNGLRYLIRENSNPRARAELRLAVAAGSVDEDDDQRGLAHFVEHMVFNGTENFAGNEIIAYLESIGARFGADLNAYTSFDETVYSLEVPTDREGLLPDGIRVLAEFASRATFESGEIEKERGVVLDEWRGRLGASTRLRDKQLPIVLQGSRYAERLPIGLPEIIEHGTRDAMLRFYQDWYRPERMAVIAVGDFDATEVEEWIRDEFGTVAATGPLRERDVWEVPGHADTLCAFADDPEYRRTHIAAIWKRADPEGTTGSLEEYEEDLLRRATLSMFERRLFERTREDAPPFLSAGLSVGRVGRSVEMSTLSASVTSNGEAAGLSALLEERARALEHGFLETELERVRRDMLSGIEASWAERDKAWSGSFAAEYVRHFLVREPIPGIEREVEIWRQFLPTITIEQCQEMFRTLFEADGIVIEASRNSGSIGIACDEALGILRSSSDLEPAAYLDRIVAEGILAASEPGTVVERREHPSVEVAELELSNGMRVFVKGTDFQDHEVQILAVALGGTSVADDADLASAEIAASLAQESGWGGRSALDLGRLLTGEVAAMSPFVAARRHGFSGSATVEDLGTALELLVLEMQRPNVDPAAFQRLLARLQSRLENRDADPRVRYQDRLAAINTSDHPRTRPLTLDRLGELEAERALDFYERWYRCPSDFAVFLVGNVDVDAWIPELERTLGSVPRSCDEPTTWVERDVRFPEGIVHETVHAGLEPQSATTITIGSYEGTDPLVWHRIRSSASILERRLREGLREDLGATYGVSVWYDHDIVGRDDGTVGVRFGCDPADADRLGDEVFRTIAALRDAGPTDEEVGKEREIQTRELEVSSRQNGFWVASLANLWVRGRDFDEMADRQTRVDELNREELHRTFRDHFQPENHTRVVWLPEPLTSEP